MLNQNNEDTTYANNTWDVILASGSLDEVLEQGNIQNQKDESTVMWYHGKITRQEAEQLLHEAITRSPNHNMDGVFLVRDTSLSDSNFSLSFLHENRCYHFFITQKKTGCYCIEGGPTVHGLEKLIAYYIDNKSQLPTLLSKICKGTAPPPFTRKEGTHNYLHKAVLESREDLVADILKNPHCPDVCAKDANGSTALHHACRLGLDKIVALLLQKDVDMTMIDVEGNMPLHTACLANKPSVCRQLISKNYRCVQEKNPYTSMVPLHMSAIHGHFECIEILLNNHAALYPRAANNETPRELAVKYGRHRCFAILKSSKEIKNKKGKQDWFHPNIDRQDSEDLLKKFDATNGLFLIRPSKHSDSQVVLSVCHGNSIRHYEINTKEYKDQTVYFIDDSPYHPSLEMLIQYYHYFEDGLQIKLKQFISKDLLKVEDVQASNNYANQPLPPSQPPQPKAKTKIAPPSPLQVKPKPELPPRPVESPTTPTPTPGDAYQEAISPKNLQREVKPKPELPPRPLESPTKVAPPTPTPGDDLIVISPKNLQRGIEIGQGEFGSVLKGVLKEKKPGLLRNTKKEVAIKTFHSVSNEEDFRQEAHAMQSLKNDYIIELLGVCYEPEMMLVEEYFPMGSMLDYLEEYPKKIQVEEHLYLWAWQIAKGMMYLETKRLVHRDLAARNILLKSAHHVKVCDFGLSRAMGVDKEYYKASKGGRWPIKWYAPESVNFGHFSHPSDVWSYGVTLWEMLSYGQAPFENMTGVEVIKYLEDGNRLKQPEHCSDTTYAIMNKCWSQEPNDRPRFTDLNDHFDSDPQYKVARGITAKKGK